MTPTINSYYFHQIVIRRGVDVGGGKRQYVSTGTVDVHLQRIDDRNDPVTGQLYGASHRLWCDVSLDIRDGDKVIDSAGNEYLVVGMRIDGVDWAINQHKELFLRKYSD